MMTPKEQLFNDLDVVRDITRTITARLKADPSVLPDIHDFLRLNAASIEAEQAIRELQHVMDVLHHDWLLRNYPHLVNHNVATDWIEAEARVQAYMRQFGPPSDVVLNATDKTP